MSEQGQATRDDRYGLAGYGCLTTLVVLGFGGGCLAFFLGISSFVAASKETLTDGRDADRFLGTLEGTVVLCAVGVLALLVGFVSSVVLLKELGDDSSRRARGPLRD